MYHVSAQGVDERMINVHYYYYYHFFLPPSFVFLYKIVCFEAVFSTANTVLRQASGFHQNATWVRREDNWYLTFQLFDKHNRHTHCTGCCGHRLRPFHIHCFHTPHQSASLEPRGCCQHPGFVFSTSHLPYHSNAKTGKQSGCLIPWSSDTSALSLLLQ